jgi:glycosyltransferase involved in cell wall biosynthesis
VSAQSGAEAPDVTFIFPAKDEEKTIGEVIEKAQRAARTLALTYEIIVADNSSDATPEIARRKGATVVTPDRLGYGYAYRYALQREGQVRGHGTRHP